MIVLPDRRRVKKILKKQIFRYLNKRGYYDNFYINILKYNQIKSINKIVYGYDGYFFITVYVKHPPDKFNISPLNISGITCKLKL